MITRQIQTLYTRNNKFNDSFSIATRWKSYAKNRKKFIFFLLYIL